MTTQSTEAAEPLDPFAFAGRLRGHIEKTRVGAQVHLAHLARKGRRDGLTEQVLPLLVQAEELIEARMRDTIATHPVWTGWAINVKGCGLMTLSAVMSRADIRRLDTVSSMWAHFGYAPGQKRIKGEKLTYDAVGRTWCWRLADSLLKQGGVCKTSLYDPRKAYEIARVTAAGGKVVPAVRGKIIPPPNMSAGQVHNRAMRYMIKGFLACLYIRWREAEGLPVRPSYAEEHPGTDGALHHAWDPDTLMEPSERGKPKQHRRAGHPRKDTRNEEAGHTQ